VALAATRDPRRAANALLAGLPKAARLGREAFAAQLVRTLADRDIVVWDRRALRRLDRVSTVVLDAPLLLTGRHLLGPMVVVAPAGSGTTGRRRGAPSQEAPSVRHRGAPSQATLSSRARSMFDPRQPAAIRRRSGWALGPLGELGVQLGRDTLRLAHQLSSGGPCPSGSEPATSRRPRSGGLSSPGRRLVLGLAYQGRLLAMFGTEPEAHAMAEPLAAEARAAGLEVVVAGIGPDVGASAVVPGGSRTASSVRALQAEGRGVVLVSSSSHAGLRAADIGIGVGGGDERGPWGADLLCRKGLEDACLILRAASTARQVSAASALMALAGSAVGGTWAVLGPASSASGRALLPVNAAALAAQATGAWMGLAAARRPAPLPADQTPWHAMGAEEVLVALGTSAVSGLASNEARRRPTAEAPATGVSFPRALLEELANPLTPLLGVGAGLSAAAGSLADAALVGSVVAVNALLGAGQRARAEEALSRLTRLAAPVVEGLRDGRVAELPASELVPGDVVRLSAGQVVPADCRVIEASSCEVDESSLTGESMPVPKSASPVPGAPVAERACMLYEGTTVVAGSARAVVVAVGAQTEAGRSVAGAEKAPPSGVEARLARITSLTVPVTVASGAAVTAMSLAKGRSTQEAVSSGVSLTVAAVPEGLPLLATTAQLAAARRLAQRGVLVRDPRAIEALGRVDILCFDKTGTLTEGRIVLRRVSDGRSDEAPDALGPAGRAVLAAALRASPVSAGAAALAHPTDRAIVDGAALAGVPAAGVWCPSRGRLRSSSPAAGDGAPQEALSSSGAGPGACSNAR
jgi:cation-transporting ATPase I